MDIFRKQQILAYAKKYQQLSNNEHRHKNIVDIVKNIIEYFPFSYFSILRSKKFQSLWNEIVVYTHFLDRIYSKNDITRVFYYINDIASLIKCSTCQKDYTHKIIPTVDPHTKFHCNTICAQNDLEIQLKIKNTKIQNKTTTRDLLHQTKQKNREKYGVDWYIQTDDFKQKQKSAYICNGYKHPMQSRHIKKQMAERYIAKHGVDMPFKNPEIQAQIKKKYKYNGINFDSAVEIAYYIWLTDNRIEFQYKPKIAFYYECNDKQHFYMPDFKVQDQYVEIKGNQFFDKNGDMQNPYDHSQDELYRAKQKCMELNNVKILKFDEYKKYLKYVQDRYGKKYLHNFKKSLQLQSSKKDELNNSIIQSKKSLDISFNKQIIDNEFELHRKMCSYDLPNECLAKRWYNNNIVKYFQQDVFYAKEKSLWLNPEIKQKLIENRQKYLNKTINDLSELDILDGFKRSGIWYGYSHFNPQIFSWFIKKFDAKICYDPCGGWGHRLLGAFNLKKYIYNDLSISTKNNVDKIIKYFGITNTETHNNDARLFMPEDDFDVMFTCPPYFNIEHYQCGDFKNIQDFNDFIDKLFEVFYNKKSCKVFGIVIREDLLKLNNYTQKYLVSKTSTKYISGMSNKQFEYLYIFDKN